MRTGGCWLSIGFPHIGQIVGGGLFIAIGWRRLTLLTTQEAVELHELELHLRSVFDLACVGEASTDAR